ncbi:hypothetical protein J4234_05510 [Candidatus Woesearchaeota archaeon]|nr:hypothetical protein [Candidatus Woesearchaeota archaeon]
MAMLEEKTLDDVVVILTSAGKGTRNFPINLYSPTSMIPKGLLRVLGTPPSELQIRQLMGWLKNFFIITQYLENDDMLSNRFGDGLGRFGVNINYSSPLEDLLNNGSGESLLRNILEQKYGGHSLVLANDNLYETDWPEVVRFHKEKGAVITVMATLMGARETIGDYGLLQVDERGRVVRITEKPKNEAELVKTLGIDDPARLGDIQVRVNTAGYVIDNPAFKDLAREDWVREKMKKESGEFDMAGGLIKGCVERGIPVYATLIDNWGDLGTNVKFLATVERALGREYPSIDSLLSKRGYHHLKNNVWVHPETYLATRNGNPSLKELIETKAVEIGPNVFIGRNVEIGKGAKIRYSSVEKRGYIGEEANISHSVIFPTCRIGKRARIDRSILGLRVVVNSSPENPTVIESSYLGPVVVPAGIHIINSPGVYPGCEFGPDRVIKDRVLLPSNAAVMRVVDSYTRREA